MTINHIPDVEPSEVDLARQLNSLLAKELGHADDPAAALTHMLGALEARAQLPLAQARIGALESQLAERNAKNAQLEAESAKAQQILRALGSATGKSPDNPDEIVGYTMAAVVSHTDHVPALIARVEAQAHELESVRAKYRDFDPVMVLFAEAIGKADAAEVARVAREALEARATKQADQARAAEIEQERALEQLDARIAKAKAEHRLTPVAESNIRHAFAAGTLTLEVVDLMCDSMPVIPAFESKYPAAPQGSHDHVPIVWNGKTWDELKPRERHALKQEDPQIYDAMRRQALGEG